MRQRADGRTALASLLALGALAPIAGCDSHRGPTPAPPAPRPTSAGPVRVAPAAPSAVAVPEKPPEPQYLEEIDLVVGLKRFKAEVAHSRAQRERGLMGRSDLEPDRGMLFVYPHPLIRRYWMKDTPTPLSIAFIADDGTIQQIEDMQAFDTTTISSHDAGPFALEMRQGWFKANGVAAGDVIHGLERAPRARD
jgi:uncharacterized membrane protein (UPF0127 family)